MHNRISRQIFFVIMFVFPSTLVAQTGQATINNEPKVLEEAFKNIENAQGLFMVRRVSTSATKKGVKIIVKGLSEKVAEQVRRKLADASSSGDPFYYDIKKQGTDDPEPLSEPLSDKRPTIKMNIPEFVDPGSPKFSNSKVKPKFKKPSLEGKTATLKLGDREYKVEFLPGGKLRIDGRENAGTWEQFDDGLSFTTQTASYRGTLKGITITGRRFPKGETKAQQPLLAWTAEIVTPIDKKANPKYRQFTLADFAGNYKVSHTNGNITYYTISSNGSVKYQRNDVDLGLQPEQTWSFVNFESELDGFRWVLTTKPARGFPVKIFVTNYPNPNVPTQLKVDNGDLLKTFN